MGQRAERLHHTVTRGLVDVHEHGCLGTFPDQRELHAGDVDLRFAEQVADGPDDTVGTPDDLPVGAAKTVPFGRYPALVIHTPDGLRAYSAVCTHFACLVKWNPDSGEIECPCHEGYFDPLDGAVLSGPPPRPLDTFAVWTAEDGQIYVGVEEAEGGETL